MLTALFFIVIFKALCYHNKKLKNLKQNKMKKTFLMSFILFAAVTVKAQLIKVGNLDNSNNKVTANQIGTVNEDNIFLKGGNSVVELNLAENNSGGAEIYYSESSLPIVGSEIHTVNFFDDKKVISYKIGTQALVEYDLVSFTLSGLDADEEILNINLISPDSIATKTFLVETKKPNGKASLKRTFFDGASFSPLEDFLAFDADLVEVGESFVYLGINSILYKRSGFSGVNHPKTDFNEVFDTDDSIIFIKSINDNVFTINESDNINIELSSGLITQEALAITPKAGAIDISLHSNGYLLGYGNSTGNHLVTCEFDANFNKLSTILINFENINSLSLIDVSGDGMREILVSNDLKFSLYKLTEDNLEIDEVLLNTPQVFTQNRQIFFRGVHEVEFIITDMSGKTLQKGEGNQTQQLSPGVHIIKITCESGEFREKISIN